MEEVDFKLLRQDIKFPLSWDCEEYKMYVFDSDMNMIAQISLDNTNELGTEHPFKDILGEMKEGERISENERFFLDNGDFYDREDGIRIGCVRGWGRLQKKKKCIWLLLEI